MVGGFSLSGIIVLMKNISVPYGWQVDVVNNLLVRKCLNGRIFTVPFSAFKIGAAEGIFKLADDGAKDYGGWAPIDEPTISIGFSDQSNGN